MTKERTIRSAVIPPPVAGWNTKDPISAMDSTFAVELENYFPGQGTVSLRNGYTRHVYTAATTGYTHLAAYSNSAGTRFLIGLLGSSGTPVNVTSAGGGSAIGGGFTTGSPENYSVNFKNLLFIKGYAANDLMYTDGTTATLPGFVGPSGDDKELWRITTYKGRLYFLTTTDASMYYADYDSISGALTKYDLSLLFTLGGKPWYIGPFSMSGGDITQNYLAAISEQGEVILFSGAYPGFTEWDIVGKYYMAAPVGRQSFFNWGTDIVIVTYDGLVSLRDIVNAPQSEYVFLSDNIASAFKTEVLNSVAAGYSNYIQGIVYPKGQYLIINFFGSGGAGTVTATQLVMNTQTRAWAKFTGQNSICWALHNNNLYFGTVTGSNNSFVGLADNGYFDENMESAGTALTRTTKMRPAYNFFGDASHKKRFLFAIPHMFQSEGMQLTMDADVDFKNVAATQTVTPDNADTSYKYYAPNVGLASVGKCASIRIDQSVTTKRLSIQAIEVFWETGTVL